MSPVLDRKSDLSSNSVTDNLYVLNVGHDDEHTSTNEQPVIPVVGDRPEIYWADDEQFYQGFAHSVDGSPSRLLYDDDDTESLLPNREVWRRLPALFSSFVYPGTSPVETSRKGFPPRRKLLERRALCALKHKDSGKLHSYAPAKITKLPSGSVLAKFIFLTFLPAAPSF